MAPGERAGGDVPSGEVTVVDALRLGWAVADVRGRALAAGPPHRTRRRCPCAPTWCCRCARNGWARRRAGGRRLAGPPWGRMGLDRDATLSPGRWGGSAPWPGETVETGETGETGATRRGQRGGRGRHHGESTGSSAVDDDLWRQAGTFFLHWDAWFQDELSRRLESLANGYLLGRGLAECYLGPGPARTSGSSTA